MLPQRAGAGTLGWHGAWTLARSAGMRRLRPSSEAEMVALFLRTEFAAARFRDTIRTLLERAGRPQRILTDPDLDDPAENQARWQLLTWHRDYGIRTGLFDGFPDDVCWEWMGVTVPELADVRYIDYDYWVPREFAARQSRLGQEKTFTAIPAPSSETVRPLGSLGLGSASALAAVQAASGDPLKRTALCRHRYHEHGARQRPTRSTRGRRARPEFVRRFVIGMDGRLWQCDSTRR